MPLFCWFDHFSNSRAEIVKFFRWYFGQNDDTKRTFWNKLTFKKREKKQVCVRLSLLLFQVSILLWPKFIDFSFFTHFPPFVASIKIYFKEFLVLCVLSFKLKGLRTILNSGNIKYIPKQTRALKSRFCQDIGAVR